MRRNLAQLEHSLQSQIHLKIAFIQRRGALHQSRSVSNIPASSQTGSQNLAHLRRAIANADAQSAQKYAVPLLTVEHSHLLNPHDLNDISALIQRHPTSASGIGIDPLVVLALRGQPDPITSAMKSALDQGRFQDVIQIWSGVQCRVAHPSFVHGPSPSSPSIRSLSSESSLKGLKGPMAYTFLALASHGEPLARVARLFLGLPSVLKLSSSELGEFARQSDPRSSWLANPSVVDLAVQYIEAIEAMRLLERHRKASEFLRKSFDGGDVESVLSFLRTILSGARSSPPWVAPTNSPEWQRGKGAAVHMTEALWCQMIAGLIKAGRSDAARLVWDQMADLQVPQTTITWNALLDGYGRRGKTTDLLTIWEAMDKNGIKKDEYSYTTVISALFLERHVDQALQVFKELVELNHQDPDHFTKLHHSSRPSFSADASKANPARPTRPQGSTLFAYNAVLHGLLICGRDGQAHQLFEDMCSKGPHPDVTSFNTFIRHYGRKGELKNIATLLRQLPHLHLQPDVFTFTSVLHSVMRSGISIPEAVKSVEAAMGASGIQPNVVTYTSIIDQILQQGGKDNITAAFEWLDIMARKGLPPNEITYTAVLAALQKDRSLDRSWLKVQTQAIISQMQSNGAKMNRVTFNILIKAALSGDSTVDGLTQAVGIYRKMTEEGVRANADTWYILLRGVIDRGEWQTGKKLLDEMGKVGFVPQTRVASLARHIEDAV